MEDTIAAIATPPGEGGIGIIRISGENALPVLEKLFTRVTKKYSNDNDARGDSFLPDASGQTVGSPIRSRQFHYGYIADPDTGDLVDEVMAVYMKGPYTYTTEDVAEIQCHGSFVSLRRILALVLRSGARMAEPGEFTKRAFLNGRLDLTQAEAVIDLIRAKTDKTFDVAMDQLEGVLSKKIRSIRKKLVDILVNVTVNIDYPDEDIEEITYEALKENLEDVGEDIKVLLDSAATGRIIQEGLAVSIIGKPNVGKSSLMNSLLGEGRAIVTDIPGTTRDTIEEHLSVKGIPVRLTDTAGIRHTEDVIEKIGIERSKAAFNQADLVIFILDSSRPLSEEDREIMALIDEKKTIIALNKADLAAVVEKDQVRKLLPEAVLIETSMETGEGIDAIEDHIVSMVYGGRVSQKDSVMVTNVRHKDILEKAKKSIEDAVSMTERKEALEFIEIDINSAYEALGEIIGETVQDDIINEVFARFCLGK